MRSPYPCKGWSLQESMFQKINTKELAVGMFIADTGVSWLTHKGLCTAEGLVDSEESLRHIQEYYSEAYIDLTRCRKNSLPPELAALTLPKPIEGHIPPPPKVPLREELNVAKAIYSQSINRVKDLVNNMHMGDLSIPADEPLVDDIIKSLDRNVDALFSLSKLLQTDEYTYTHCVNVSVLVMLFARGLGLDEDTQRALGLGGLFHDLGKTLIPKEILLAPRALSVEEFAVIKHHPSLGYDQLISVQGVQEALLSVVMEHHERFDGSGYPLGLRGEGISLAGTLTGIVDVFDALSSRRCYKDALPLPKVTSILYSMRDKAFPAYLVEKFIVLVGVYPVGSCVQISDGRYGIVSGSNPANILKPKVILVKNSRGFSIEPLEIDLMQEQEISVLSSVPSTSLGIDPAEVMGLYNK